jgi:TATA-box binding protein (TBP) (component of TFIID and TFIIIB)
MEGFSLSLSLSLSLMDVNDEMDVYDDMIELFLHDPFDISYIDIFDSQIRIALASWPSSRITTTTTIYKLSNFDANSAADHIGEDCNTNSDKYTMLSLDGAVVDVFNKMKNCITFKWPGCAIKVFTNGTVHVTGPRTIGASLKYVNSVADLFECNRPSSVTVCLCNLLLPPDSRVLINFSTIRRFAPKTWLISVNNERFSGMRIKFKDRSGTMLISRKKIVTLAGFDDIASMCEAMYDLKQMMK